MTWHLKDRELEKVFEAYSGGKFVKALNYAIEQENMGGLKNENRNEFDN